MSFKGGKTKIKSQQVHPGYYIRKARRILIPRAA